MREYIEVIQARREELAKARGRYQEALAQAASGVDSAALLDLASLLSSYQPGDTPEKAVYVVAQATIGIRDLIRPYAIIQAYENKRNQLKALEDKYADYESFHSGRPA